MLLRVASNQRVLVPAIVPMHLLCVYVKLLLQSDGWPGSMTLNYATK